jgi:HemY protein
MKFIFIAILALIIASGLAYQVHLEPGYALLSYGNISVETSLAVFLFITSVAFIVFYFTLRTILTIKGAPKALRKWNTNRKLKKSRKALNKGLIDSAEGNWQQSEKSLIKHAKNSDTPLLNYLSAAHAAQSQHAYDRRDDYLFKAGEALPEQMHAIHLTRAKLQLSAGQVEQALATLQQLKEASPKHPVVLTLLMKAYLQLADWNNLQALLPSIKSNSKIAQEEWRSIEHETILNLLKSARNTNQNDLDTLWKTLDKKQTSNHEFLAAYASHLMTKGESHAAEGLLLKGLKSQQSNSLLALYSRLNIPSDKKIKQLEQWLKIQSTSPELLNSVAQLCLDQKLWGKAKTYLDKSLAIQPSSLAYMLLGNALENLDDANGAANECYKAGLAISLTGNTMASALK